MTGLHSLPAWIRAAIAASLLLAGCHSDKPGEPRIDPAPFPALERESGGESSTPTSTWFVLRVIDGDTIVARLEEPGKAKRREKIRLLRINTPEKKQPGYEEASEALKYLVRGGEIQLEFEDPSTEKRGNYGRLLAYVMVDGLNANVEMVRLGWTRFWTKYGRGRLAREFMAAQEEAREARRGLWSTSGFSVP